MVNASQPRPSYLLPLNPSQDPWSWYQRTLTFQASACLLRSQQNTHGDLVRLPLSICLRLWWAGSIKTLSALRDPGATLQSLCSSHSKV